MLCPTPPTTVPNRRYARRRLLAAGAALVCAGHGWPVARAASPPVPAPPGAWRTWLLDRGDELRPSPPPAPSAAELEEVRGLQARRTAAIARQIDAWSQEPALLPWTDLALDLVVVHQPSPVRAGRALALLHAALQDAVTATWDAKIAFPRPTATSLDSAIVPLANDATPSPFPSEHAALAGAAGVVLASLFPAEAASVATLVDDAAGSRLWAGTNVRSDVEAGLALGRAVGERAVARGKADRSDVGWDGSGRPSGPGAWQPTPPAFVQRPADPLAGTWTTWVVPGGDADRPPPPPPWGSPAWQAELAAVQEAVARRTPEQEQAVRYWAGGPGTVTPAGLWTRIARRLIVRDGLDLPHAARALALTTVAMADGFICCWDAKYAYWTARPITADPTLAVLIPTPPFPSYTSGHATISAAAAAVLGHLFPADDADLAARATEAKNSRLWAGIHFPLDNEMGATAGGRIGRLVVERARQDGADPST